MKNFERSAAIDETPPGFVTSLGVANFGIYLALLTPVFVSIAFKLDHITASREESLSALGLVMGVGSLFAMIFNPLVGRLSDRTSSKYGMRRPWIILGAILGSVGLVIIGIATHVWMVLAGWCLAQAAFNGALAALNATVADHVSVNHRGTVSGVIGLTTSLGILVGTFSTDFLETDLSRFAIPSLVAVVAAALFALMLQDRKLGKTASEPYGLREFVGSFTFNPLKAPDFGWIWLTTFAVMFGYAGVATFLPMFLMDRFALDEPSAIRIILISNIAAIVAQAVSSTAAGFLSDKLALRRPFVAIACLIMVAGLITLALAPTPEIVIAGQTIIGLGMGCFFSVSLALATQLLPNEQDTAKDLGVINIASTLPQSLAPAIAPPLIALGSYSLFYLVAAFVTLVGAATVYLIRSVK
ncbi:multidrug resistance protein [compost metagenome]